jgi:hypothetical protein
MFIYTCVYRYVLYTRSIEESRGLLRARTYAPISVNPYMQIPYSATASSPLWLYPNTLHNLYPIADIPVVYSGGVYVLSLHIPMLVCGYTHIVHTWAPPCNMLDGA